MIHKEGYPEYHNLVFDKSRLNQYLHGDFNDPSFQSSLSQEDDLFLQIFVLYISWIEEHKMSAKDSMLKLQVFIE